jgi:hypothetical protein
MSAVILASILDVSIGLAGSWLFAQEPLPQYGRKPLVDKGPRALGLVQLSPKGKKGRLIPIVIMMGGKFYDAGSYKAMPVPMALDFDTVYEGFRSGVSQGVFTITQPGQLNHVWIAEGTWLPAGEKAPERSKKYSAPVIDDKDAPPVLHRRSEKAAGDSGSASKDKDKVNDKEKDKDKGKDADTQKAAAPGASPTTTPSASAGNAADTAKPATAPESAKAAADEPIADPNRPRLRRGKPDSSTRREPYTTFDEIGETGGNGGTSDAAKPDAKTPKDSAASLRQIVTIPAISDAGGPDPRPYTYDVKPAEEAVYRNKMLDLAAMQLHGRATTTTKAVPASKKASAGKSPGKSAGKLPKPDFDNVSLRIFDLSNANEPVLVLSARTHPPAAGSSGDVEEPKEITLIARTNLEGELRKLFFSQTDSRHLDATPRLELIDAVDVDGDGRGELLFRRTFDNGSAYAIYRVTSDGLWPLFEGNP